MALTGLTARIRAADSPRKRPLPRGPQLSRRQLVFVTVLLGIMCGLGPATVDMYLPALPDLAREFMTTTASVQITLTGSLVGMAVGQLVIGPMSDTLGRRRPLLWGVAVHVVSSLAVMAAPSIAMIAALRLLQGFGAAAAAIVAMAIVRDLFVGRGASAMLSRLMLVTGIAPVIAPAVGGFMLGFTGWRGIFAVLAVISLGVIAVCAWALPETLPPQERIEARPATIVRTIGGLLRDRVYVGAALTQAFMFGASFSYVSGMAFILQDGYGMSPSQFGYMFSAGTIGMIVMSQVNPIMLRRYSPGQVLVVGLIGVILAGATMTVLTLNGVGGMWGLLIPIWVALGFQQFIAPNTASIALARNGHRAGTAAAFMGAGTNIAGAAAAPLIGLVGSTQPAPLAIVMLGFYLMAAFWTATLIRRSGIRDSDVAEPRTVPAAPAIADAEVAPAH